MSVIRLAHRASRALSLRPAVSGTNFRTRLASFAPLSLHDPSARLYLSTTATKHDETVQSSKNVVSEDARPKPPPGKPAFRLRPYQRECVEACVNALRDNYSRIGVSSPTGSGKTAMFSALVRRLPALRHSEWIADRVLILVGSVELARQAATAVSNIWPDLSVEIEQGKSVASGLADVTVATYQTLAMNSYARLAKFDPDLYKAVVVDEAHHASAKSYLAILSHFNSSVDKPYDDVKGIVEPPTPASPISPPDESDPLDDVPIEAEPAQPPLKDDQGRTMVPILGFTATFGRADGRALGKVFEKVVYHSEWLDMIKAGWLSELKFTTVLIDKEALDLDQIEVSKSSGEFVLSSLQQAVDRKEVLDFTVRAWFDKAQGRRSTLVFAVSIAHINSLVDAFRERGVDARYVYEGTPPKDREQTIAAFKAGEFPVLVNCGILTEGADVPAIDCILMARPTRSQNLFLQMLGRGLRRSPETGKKDCLVIDLVGNSSRGAMNTPTLFGVDPNAPIEEVTSEELDQLSQEAKPVVDYVMPSDESEVEYRDFASFEDLIKPPSAALESYSTPSQWIRSVSRLAWVAVTDESFALEVPMYGRIRINRRLLAPGKTNWEASWYGIRSDGVGRKPIRMKPSPIASDTDLETLVRTTDTWIATERKTKFPTMSLSTLETRAMWRSQPATLMQRNQIRSRLQKITDEEVMWGFTNQEDGVFIKTISGVWVGRPANERVVLDKLTKGEASDALTRFSLGTLLAYRNQLKGIKQGEKEQRRAQRERILVASRF